MERRRGEAWWSARKIIRRGTGTRSGMKEQYYANILESMLRRGRVRDSGPDMMSRLEDKNQTFTTSISGLGVNGWSLYLHENSPNDCANDTHVIRRHLRA